MSSYDLQEAVAAVSLSCPIWTEMLHAAQQQSYFQALQATLAERSQVATVYPPAREVFTAFELTPFARTKVVILGQDPYHQPNQAHGLAFSVAHGVKPPPSLRNIYCAVQHDDADFVIPKHGNLQAWAKQGVLMLNTVLTVEHGQAHAHAKIGWQTFTDAVMETLNGHPEPLVFMLWGKHAQQKGQLITSDKHLKLHAVHPSPLSAYRGFLTCGHFDAANKFLDDRRGSQINWALA